MSRDSNVEFANLLCNNNDKKHKKKNKLKKKSKNQKKKKNHAITEIRTRDSNPGHMGSKSTHISTTPRRPMRLLIKIINIC